MARPMIGDTLKSAALLGTVGGLIVACCGVLGGDLGILVGVALGLGVTVIGSSWWFSDRLAIRAAGARVLDPSEAPGLHAMVAELAQRAAMLPPGLYLSSSPQPNAFAAGRTAGHASVVVTEGLLALLNPDEVRAVLAYELAHIRRGDALLSSLAGAVATAISALANVFLLSSLFGGRSSGERPGRLRMLLVASVAHWAAVLLRLTLSARREYDTDRAGADMTDDPEALARALERMGCYVDVVPMDLIPAQATVWVVNPLGTKVAVQKFSTHPPVVERTTRLRIPLLRAGADIRTASRRRMWRWRHADADHGAGGRG